VLAWLSVWSDVQTCRWPSWCYWHSLSLASVKSRLVISFWFRLTWVVLDERPLNGCACVYNVITFIQVYKRLDLYLIDVWMPHFGKKFHSWWRIWIVVWKFHHCLQCFNITHKSNNTIQILLLFWLELWITFSLGFQLLLILESSLVNSWTLLLLLSTVFTCRNSSAIPWRQQLQPTLQLGLWAAVDNMWHRLAFATRADVGCC